MNPIADADLTCISNHPVATYSGFLPAVLAGQKTVAQMQIDLVRLCAAVGARLITAEVTGLDHGQSEILFADRPAIPFDVLSIGIGSVPSMGNVRIEGDSLIKIKPMQTFLPRLRDAIKRFGDRSLQVAVVGGGVAGVEISFCLPAFLRQYNQHPHRLVLITGSDQVLPEAAAGTRARVLAEFQRREVHLINGSRVVAVSEGNVQLDDGVAVAADLVIWATGAVAPPLLSKLDLPLDDRGFLTTDRSLRSTSGRPIFAVGDSGTISGENLPKAGVYAVRQGPVLWDNLERSLDGQPLIDYRPQRSFLKLINKGDGTAIGQWKGLAFAGTWVLKLKDRIDSQFMEKYQPKPMIDADQPMQCRGCGCKLGAGDLDSALVGHNIELEDAAEIGQTKLVVSTDFFTSPFQDAYLVGRITALHSASDIIVSGAAVSHALANVVLPAGDTTTQRRTLSDFLAGARHEFDAMGASIIGGHTIVGPRMEVGFTVIGKQIGETLIRKRNLQVGDRLYLSKPLGTGILLAAHMRSLCPADAFESLIRCMLVRQHELARIAVESQVTAATDVTGFGLAGHLVEMLQASGVSATIQLNEIPLLPGAGECLQQGIESSLAPANRRFAAEIAVKPDSLSSTRYRAPFDPQTCGGVLLGVDAGAGDRLLDALAAAGLDQPTLIGTVCSRAENAKRILLH